MSTYSKPLHSVLCRWTGSNTNPNNNDGQGRAGSDRSNIVLLRDQNYDEGMPGRAVPLGRKFGHFGNSYPAHLDNASFLGFPRHIKQNLAVLDNGELCLAGAITPYSIITCSTIRW